MDPQRAWVFADSFERCHGGVCLFRWNQYSQRKASLYFFRLDLNICDGDAFIECIECKVQTSAATGVQRIASSSQVPQIRTKTWEKMWHESGWKRRFPFFQLIPGINRHIDSYSERSFWEKVKVRASDQHHVAWSLYITSESFSWYDTFSNETGNRTQLCPLWVFSFQASPWHRKTAESEVRPGQLKAPLEWLALHHLRSLNATFAEP